MADLSALQEEIQSNTDVTESVRLLVNRLADELEAAGGDQAAIDDIVSQLRDNDTTLADLVVANTPADTGGGTTDTGGTGGDVTGPVEPSDVG